MQPIDETERQFAFEIEPDKGKLRLPPVHTAPTRYSRTTTERGTPTSQRIRGMMISRVLRRSKLHAACKVPALSFRNVRLGLAFACRIAGVEMVQDAIVAELRAAAASLVTASAAAEAQDWPRLKSAPWTRKIGWSAC